MDKFQIFTIIFKTIAHKKFGMFQERNEIRMKNTVIKTKMRAAPATSIDAKAWTIL